MNMLETVCVLKSLFKLFLKMEMSCNVCYMSLVALTLSFGEVYRVARRHNVHTTVVSHIIIIIIMSVFLEHFSM